MVKYMIVASLLALTLLMFWMGRNDLVPVSIQFVLVQGTDTGFSQVLTVKNQSSFWGYPKDIPLNSGVKALVTFKPLKGKSLCDSLPWTAKIDALKSGKSQKISFDWAGTGRTLSDLKTCVGSWRVFVDNSNAIDESNELNNTVDFVNQNQ